MDATVAHDGRTKVAVFSHERSGTHFLMNTLALNYGYVSRPWWNLDLELGLNFHAPGALRAYLDQARNVSVLNVLKAHHHASFIEDLVDALRGQFHIFYVCRDPRDTLVSFWRHLRALPWDEGPKTEDVAAFLRAAPRGGILRYQKEQAPTMVHRWRDHVDGWLDLAGAHPDLVSVVRYEDLNLRFDDTVESLGPTLDLAPVHRPPVRPGLHDNVIGRGEGRVGGYAAHLSGEDQAFVREVAGATMDRMEAWAPTPVSASQPQQRRAAAG